MVVCCGIDIARVLGRNAGTRVSRGESMTVKVWRGWHSRKAFIEDTACS